MSPSFRVELDRERYTAGDAVRGTVLVLEGGGSRTLEVFVHFKEETEDYEETPLSLASGPLHSGELAQGMSYAFELRLPEDAPPSLSSEHGELYWELDVRSDELGLDTHERLRIDVVARPLGG